MSVLVDALLPGDPGTRKAMHFAAAYGAAICSILTQKGIITEDEARKVVEAIPGLLEELVKRDEENAKTALEELRKTNPTRAAMVELLVRSSEAL